MTNKLIPILLVVVLGGCSSHKLTEPNRYVNPTLDACMNLDCPSAKTLCKNISDDECRMVIRRHNMKVLSDYKDYTVKPRSSYSGYSSSSISNKKKIEFVLPPELKRQETAARIDKILAEFGIYPQRRSNYQQDEFDTMPDSDPDASGGGDVW